MAQAAQQGRPKGRAENKRNGDRLRAVRTDRLRQRLAENDTYGAPLHRCQPPVIVPARWDVSVRLLSGEEFVVPNLTAAHHWREVGEKLSALVDEVVLASSGGGGGSAVALGYRMQRFHALQELHGAVGDMAWDIADDHGVLSVSAVCVLEESAEEVEAEQTETEEAVAPVPEEACLPHQGGSPSPAAGGTEAAQEEALQLATEEGSYRISAAGSGAPVADAQQPSHQGSSGVAADGGADTAAATPTGSEVHPGGCDVSAGSAEANAQPAYSWKRQWRHEDDEPHMDPEREQSPMSPSAAAPTLQKEAKRRRRSRAPAPSPAAGEVAQPPAPAYPQQPYYAQPWLTRKEAREARRRMSAPAPPREVLCDVCGGDLRYCLCRKRARFFSSA